MAENSQLAPRQETGMEKVKGYLLSPEVKERFTDMMGREGIYYLNQVLILVANDPKLQECSPKSILISAMRAASLRLSVDKGQGQAWIIPYNKIATFQLGYKGVYELAMRTNLYRFINDKITIYDGEQVIEDRMTGQHKIVGQRTSDRVIGRMLYFQLISGFEKTFYMTVEEIEAHARHYSKAYKSPDSKWNDPHERPKMERKTVLMNGLRRYGRFNADDLAIIDEIEQEQGFVGRVELPEENEVTPPDSTPAKTPEQIQSELGYDADPATGEIKPETESPVPPMTPAEPKPTEPPAILATIQQMMGLHTSKPNIDPKRVNMLAPIIESVFATGDAEAKRHMVLKALFGKPSLKEISIEQASLLYHWLRPFQDSGGEWKANQTAASQLLQLVAELDKIGQPSLL